MKKLTIGVIVFLLIGSVALASGVKIINEKAAFPEGPCWHKGKLFYVEYGGNTVKTWDGTNNSTFWRQDGCGPSAVVPNASGEMWVTCYDSGEMVRISASGKTIASHKNDKAGQPFVGPNDVVADKKGGIYFTASGPWESAPIVGKIFYINADGVITEVANDIHYANGLALSQDEKTLFCAESEASRIIQFTVGSDGSLSDRRLFIRVGAADAKSGMMAYPDGIKVDNQGNLYIGQFSMGRIVVISQEGKFVRAYDVPSPSAPNLAFNPDQTSMFVMAVDDVNNAPYWGKVYQLSK